MKRRGFLGSLLGIGAVVPVSVIAGTSKSKIENPCIGFRYVNIRTSVPVKTGDKMMCVKNGKFIDGWPARDSEPYFGIAMFDLPMTPKRPQDMHPLYAYVTIEVTQ